MEVEEEVMGVLKENMVVDLLSCIEIVNQYEVMGPRPVQCFDKMLASEESIDGIRKRCRLFSSLNEFV